MATVSSGQRRIKVNFMISSSTLDLLKETVALGDRSDFVNSALESQLLSNKKAQGAKMMNEFRAKHKFNFTDSQIIEARNYGRK